MTREEAIDILKDWDGYFIGHSSDDVNDALDTAIKTLKQEPCEDCISRAQALSDYADWYGYGYRDNAFYKLLKDMPPATPKQRWTPVSERLPENKETVLVTFKHFVSGNTIGLGSMILLRGKPHWHVREQNLGTYDVLAWMPLPPKPYEPQESEG